MQEIYLMNMSWDKVDKKYMRVDNGKIIAAPGDYQRLFLINTILEEFPGLNRSTVTRTLDQCINEQKTPAGRKEFFRCLAEKLGN